VLLNEKKHQKSAKVIFGVFQGQSDYKWREFGDVRAAYFSGLFASKSWDNYLAKSLIEA